MDTAQGITEEKSSLFGGSVILRAQGTRTEEDSWSGGLYSTEKPEQKPAALLAVPYAYWNNREPGEMAVWIREI